MRRKRQHEEGHTIVRQRIGAGLVRTVCADCPHVGIEVASAPLHPLATGQLPEWMVEASTRFEEQATDLAPA